VALPTADESRALLAHAGDEGWWFRAKEDIVAGMIAPYVGPDCRVLVIGIGSGGTVRRVRALAPHAVLQGIDIDPQAVALLRRLDPDGTYRVADVEHDELGAPGSADLVVALDVIEHLDDDVGVVRRIFDVLAPGGVLVAHVPTHPWMFSSHDVHLGHRRRYRPRLLRSLLRDAGFERVHDTPLFMTTLVLLAVWRQGLQRLFRLRTDRSDVSTSLPGLVDAVLYGIARAEGVVARLRLPFGSSHLAVVRRPHEASYRSRSL
jgi:SAM-dependent methyltransferase